jgi:Transglycosylase SLT domain
MANTVIDSLVVLLDLDPSKFDAKKKQALKDLREQKEEVRKGTKQYEQYGKSGAEAFAQVRNEALRYLGVFLGAKAIKDFTQDTVQQGAALGRVAYNAGVSTNALSVWQKAVQLTGGSADAAGQSMFAMSQAITRAGLLGDASVIPFFRSLGVELIDANGKLKTADQLLIEIADNIQKGKISGSEASTILSQLGINQDTINLVERGGDAVRKYLEEGRKISAVNDENSASFEHLNTAWTLFTGEIEKSATTLLARVAPILDYILALGAKTVSWLDSHNIFGDEIDPDTGAVKNKSGFTKGVESGVTSNANKGLIVDPFSGAVVPYTPSGGGDNDYIFKMIQHLEGSRSNQVSPKGAVGRNQILPGTAAQYGFDPSKLSDPAYNDIVARAIEADLSKRYNGDPELIALAYHNGKGAADRYQRFGKNASDFGPETQGYLARERAYVANHTTNVYGDVNVVTQATDAPGIAKDIKSELQSPDSTVRSLQVGNQ